MHERRNGGGNWDTSTTYRAERRICETIQYTSKCFHGLTCGFIFLPPSRESITRRKRIDVTAMEVFNYIYNECITIGIPEAGSNFIWIAALAVLDSMVVPYLVLPTGIDQ
jgi:hypothetical protein